MDAQVQDTAYTVVVTLDNNLVDNSSRPYYDGQTIPTTEPHITLTALVRDSENNPAGDRTVYWHCPRNIVQFFNDDYDNEKGNIVNSCVTGGDGKATIHACANKPAIALITASLEPPTNKNESIEGPGPIVNGGEVDAGPYSTYAVFNTISNNTHDYPKIQGHSVIIVSSNRGDNNDNWVPSRPFTIAHHPTMSWDGNALVAAWLAQIDYPNNDVSRSVLLGPQTHDFMFANLVPGSWKRLQENGIQVPYEVMDYESAGTLNNVIQYMVQDTYDSGHIHISPWHQFGAKDTPWAQPDPNRPINSDKYLTPIVLNVLKQEVVNPGTLSNSDYFIEENNTQWLMFNIHTDHLSIGDKIQPYVFVNGYNSGGHGGKISNYFSLPEKEVTQDVKDNQNILTIKVAAVQIDQYCKKEQYSGQLDVTYFVNQWAWSEAFSAPTDFTPK